MSTDFSREGPEIFHSLLKKGVVSHLPPEPPLKPDDPSLKLCLDLPLHTIAAYRSEILCRFYALPRSYHAETFH